MANRQSADARLDPRAQTRASSALSQPRAPAPRRLPWIPEPPLPRAMESPTSAKPSSASAPRPSTRPRITLPKPIPRPPPKKLRAARVSPTAQPSPAPRTSHVPPARAPSTAKPRIASVFASVSKHSPTRATAQPGAASTDAPPLSLDAKRALLEPDVCVWARMEGLPWWPTVLRRHADVEPTLEVEDALPAETRDNRLVEFFNDNKRIAVMNINDLEEYTGSMNLLEEAGKDIREVLAACVEADAYIRSSGPIFQREAIGSAFSKKARARKKHYGMVKTRANMAARFITSTPPPELHDALPVLKDKSIVASAPVGIPLQLAPHSLNLDGRTAKFVAGKSSVAKPTSTKDALFNVTPVKTAASETKKRRRVSGPDSRGSAITAAESTGTSGVNKSHPRIRRPISQLTAKRPRIKDHVIVRSDHSEFASSPDSTPLKLFLSVGGSGSRSKSFNRPPPRSGHLPQSDKVMHEPPPPPPPQRRRRLGIANLSASTNVAGCTKSGSGVGTGREEEDEDWGKAGEEAMERMKTFASGLKSFLGRKKNLQDEVRDLVNTKMALEEENKMLGEKNELLKIVNEEQHNLAALVQKRGDELRTNVAKQRAESAKLNEKIGEQRRTHGELQRWFDETHDLSSELMKERRELYMEVQALRSRARQVPL